MTACLHNLIRDEVRDSPGLCDMVFSFLLPLQESIRWMPIPANDRQESRFVAV